MKRIFLLACVMLPLMLNAQKNEKINFVDARNWDEVLQLAKKEHKPIFIDAYATWCGPCKQMDKEVFTDPEVAAFANENFISVKVQADSTKHDSPEVKSWYADVKKMSPYIEAFPTFLFFSSDGEYSGKEQGFYNPGDFLVVLQKVIDPSGSYLNQLREFEAGTLNRPMMLKLAYWAKDNNDKANASKIASSYKSKYIDVLPLDSLLTPEADYFRWSFPDLYSFNDKVITFMYEKPDVADTKIGRYSGFSKASTDYIIKRDYILNQLPAASDSITTPKWSAIERKVAKRFDKTTAKRLTLDVKIYYAFLHKRWEKAISLEFEKIDHYGKDTTGSGLMGINNLMYDVVFKHVSDKKLLERAVVIMESVISLDTTSENRYDTYACVLYKAGKKEEAIKQEEKALSMAKKFGNLGAMDRYGKKLSAMKEDKPIWKDL